MPSPFPFDLPVKAISRNAALAALAAVIVGVVALRDSWSSPAAEEGHAGVDASEGSEGTRETKSRTQDPARHRRIAERLLGIASATAMTGMAGDGESRFHHIASSLGPGDFAGILRELAPMDQPEMAVRVDDLRLKLLLAWAEKEPGAAASFAREEGIPAEACGVVAGAWSKTDPDAALSWARGLPEEGHRQQALVGIGNEVVFRDPQQAIELGREAGTGPVAEALLNQAAAVWAAKDPEAAAGWASEVTDSELRQKLIVGVATAWADLDPHAASMLVIDSMKEGSLEENALVGIVQRLAFRDMESARDWVARFPEGRMRERAETELTRISARSPQHQEPARAR